MSAEDHCWQPPHAAVHRKSRGVSAFYAAKRAHVLVVLFAKLRETGA